MKRLLLAAVVVCGAGCFDFRKALEDCGDLCTGGSTRDAGVRDAGSVDAGQDAGDVDSGTFDAGVDAGLPDAGRPDAGPVDAGAPVGAACAADLDCLTGYCGFGTCSGWTTVLPGANTGFIAATPDNRALLAGTCGASIDFGGAQQMLTALGGAYFALRTSRGNDSSHDVYKSLTSAGSVTIDATAVHADAGLVVVGVNRAPDVAFGPFSLAAMDSNGDLFAVRIEPSTSTVIWATGLGSATNDDSPSVAFDRRGDVYVQGWTYGTSLRVAPSNGSPTNFNTGRQTPGAATTFIVKLNGATGQPVWTQFLVSSAFAGGRAITYSAFDDSIVVGGSAISDLFIDGGVDAGPYTGLIQRDAFLAKFDAASGALRWSRVFGGGDQDGVDGLAVDSAGNIFAAGLLATAGITQPFGPNVPVLIVPLSPYVLKVSSDNQPVWFRAFPATGVLAPRVSNGNALSTSVDHVALAMTPSQALAVYGWSRRPLSTQQGPLVSPDGGVVENFLFQLGTEDGSVSRVLRFAASEGAIAFPAFAPNGNLFLAGAFNGTLALPLDGGTLGSNVGVRLQFAASLGQWR